MITKNKNIFISLILLSSLLFLATVYFQKKVAYSRKLDETKAASADVVVDFSSPVTSVNPLAFGVDISTYGYGNYLFNDQKHKTALTRLRPKLMRLHLAYTTLGGAVDSPLSCHANGCNKSLDGNLWVNGIKAVGAEPVLIVTASGTHSIAQDVLEAKNMVTHFNVSTHNSVKRWIIGNEPDNSGNPDHMDATTYSAHFNAMYDAMIAVDPTIKIGGPATAYFDTNFLQTFISLSGSRLDFLDFHSYGEGTSTIADTTLLASTGAHYEDTINQLRSMAVNTKHGTQTEIQVGEWNMSWTSSVGNANNFYTHYNTVWSASSLGHILKAGGISLMYSDKNGALGLLYDKPGNNTSIDDPMPIYHGYGMFTGEGLFPGFGDTLVKSEVSIPSIEVFSSNNPKRIVLINKDSSLSRTLSMSLNGVSSSAVTIWRKDTTSSPTAPPSSVGTISYTGGNFNYVAPPYSVTTFVFGDGSPQVSNTPVPSTSATYTIQAPSGYSFSKDFLGTGKEIYLNENRFSFFGLPAALQNISYIKTQNVGIKEDTALNWSITLNQSGKVYILYRKIPGQTAPNWIKNSYTKNTTDDYSSLQQFVMRKNDQGLIGLYDIYSKNYAAGSVPLGPASDATTTAYSMYVVGVGF